MHLSRANTPMAFLDLASEQSRVANAIRGIVPMATSMPDGLMRGDSTVIWGFLKLDSDRDVSTWESWYLEIKTDPGHQA